MNRKKFTLIAIAATLSFGILAVMPAKAQEESFAIDPNTGDYHIRYKSVYDGDLVEVTFVPATKIDPVLISKFNISDRSNIDYRYKVRNGTQGRQPLIGFRLSTPTVNTNSQVIPPGWDGNILANIGKAGASVNWHYSDLGSESSGLRPGQSQSGFGIVSSDLPGIGTARLHGNTPIQGFPDPGPDPDSPVGKQFNELHSKNFVPRPAAVPLIPVPNPFDAAAVLTSMQKHVNQDLVTMNLIDPAFASQLDRLFQTAIAAAKGGNAVALKGNLKDLRQMLKREHADVDKDNEDRNNNDDDKNKEKDKSPLIDKLAAKVLDFDLKYIQKRLGHND
jgi:hypothetical protein